MKDLKDIDIQLIGSDISFNAVETTKKNFEFC